MFIIIVMMVSFCNVFNSDYFDYRGAFQTVIDSYSLNIIENETQ